MKKLYVTSDEKPKFLTGYADFIMSISGEAQNDIENLYKISKKICPEYKIFTRQEGVDYIEIPPYTSYEALYIECDNPVEMVFWSGAGEIKTMRSKFVIYPRISPYTGVKIYTDQVKVFYLFGERNVTYTLEKIPIFTKIDNVDFCYLEGVLYPVDESILAKAMASENIDEDKDFEANIKHLVASEFLTE
ncbi:MAG TPA: hypothetical protein PKD85_00630 [Saprospiraceae bacterium]|nr:hypothetical protein [Saprospiraceae bacterium]